MLRLLRFSEKIGFVGTAVLLCAFLLIAAIVIDFAFHFFAAYNSMATATVLSVLLICLAVYGGLICVWFLKCHFDDWRRGYRVRWLSGVRWVYEERGSEQRIVPYLREVNGRGYPEPCTIRITDDDFPEWAVDRKNEIVERIAICHGIDQGGKIEVSQTPKQHQNN